jgi:hypothetical protein
MYHITDYSKAKAKSLGVVIKPSTNPKKKIDIFKQSKKIATIGDIHYSDYPNYLKNKGKEYADMRKNAYDARHKKDMNVYGTNGFYAKRILW